MNDRVVRPDERPSYRVSVIAFFGGNVKSRHCSLLIFTAKPRLKIRDRIEKFCHATVYHVFIIPLFNAAAHNLNGRPIGRKEQCLHRTRIVYFKSKKNFSSVTCRMEIFVEKYWYMSLYREDLSYGKVR